MEYASNGTLGEFLKFQQKPIGISMLNQSLNSNRLDFANEMDKYKISISYFNCLVQILNSVVYLHQLGIAHCNICSYL